MKLKLFLLFFLLLAAPGNIYAEVYWLKDILERVKNTQPQKYPEKYNAQRVPDVLHFNYLFSENISVNDENGKLHVGLLDYTYKEFLFNLRYLGLKNFASTDSNTVIVFGDRRYLVLK